MTNARCCSGMPTLHRRISRYTLQSLAGIAPVFLDYATNRISRLGSQEWARAQDVSNSRLRLALPDISIILRRLVESRCSVPLISIVVADGNAFIGTRACHVW